MSIKETEFELEQAHSKYKLSVPLFRQRFNLDEWQEDGFTSPEESIYWSNRSCGIACVRMAIGFFCTMDVPSLSELLQKALRISGYCPRGWIHSKLVELLCFYDLSAIAIGIDSEIDLIISAIKHNKLVIASVSDGFPSDGRKGGHLVVVTGYSQQQSQKLISFNDPSAWGQHNSSVSFERFMHSFSGRIIIVSDAGETSKK